MYLALVAFLFTNLETGTNALQIRLMECSTNLEIEAL